MLRIHPRIFVYILPLMVIAFSCTPQKRLIYLQGDDARTAEAVLQTKPFEYRVQERDVLMIDVQSSDEATAKAFSVSQTRVTQTTATQNFDGSQLALTGFVVSDSGYINLPMIGDIYVAGMLVDEVQKTVSDAIRLYVTDAWVSVRLVSFKVTLLGEINRPGIYRTYENRLNLLDALGMAGDLTEFGDRQRIALIRQDGDKRRIQYIDITKQSIIESDAYNLLPNDVIYVPSLKAKSWGFANAITPITLALSLVSTTVLIINFISR
jgi:polysaccharide biosynthesis/export protein